MATAISGNVKGQTLSFDANIGYCAAAGGHVLVGRAVHRAAQLAVSIGFEVKLEESRFRNTIPWWRSHTTPFHKGLQFRASLGKHQRVHGHLPGFLMDLYLETLFQNRLEHRPLHQSSIWNDFRFRLDREELGVKPVRPSFRSVEWVL